MKYNKKSLKISMYSILKLGLIDSLDEQKLIQLVTAKSQVFKTVSLCVC